MKTILDYGLGPVDTQLSGRPLNGPVRKVLLEGILNNTRQAQHDRAVGCTERSLTREIGVDDIDDHYLLGWRRLSGVDLQRQLNDSRIS
jgi:hypothetical protein